MSSFTFPEGWVSEQAAANRVAKLDGQSICCICCRYASGCAFL